MDALGAKPENWEGAGVGGPNQLYFRVLKRKSDF